MVLLLLEGVWYELFVQFWGRQHVAAGQGTVVLFSACLQGQGAGRLCGVCWYFPVGSNAGG